MCLYLACLSDFFWLLMLRGVLLKRPGISNRSKLGCLVFLALCLVSLDQILTRRCSWVGFPGGNSRLFSGIVFCFPIPKSQILLSPEMRSLSFANREALVAWLSFQKVTKRYADELSIFLELTPTRFPEQLCLFRDTVWQGNSYKNGGKCMSALDPGNTLKSSVFLDWVSLQMSATGPAWEAFSLVSLVLSKLVWMS